MDLQISIFFLVLSFLASFVNGAIGYGYSSISIPLALLILSNRIINPAYVILEAFVNTLMLLLSGKKANRAVFRRNIPILFAMIPGVIFGSLLLGMISPNYVRFVVYSTILPFALLQTVGFRRQIKSESTTAVPLGTGIGMIYSITTISGPPIALFWNNQGLTKNEFKAALSQVRVFESYLTALSYFLIGFYSNQSLELFYLILPSMFFGLPLGIQLSNNLNTETFRRICMTVNCAVCGYGMSRLLPLLFGVGEPASYLFFFALLCLCLLLLYHYFKHKRATTS